MFKRNFNRIDWLVFDSLTLTLIVTGVLMGLGFLGTGLPDNILFASAKIILLIAYFMVLKISKDLKKKDIDGVEILAWATFMWYLMIFATSGVTETWFIVIKLICNIAYIFWFVLGFLQLCSSIVKKIKNNRENADNIDIAVAIVTSVVSIVLSIIDLLL